MLDIIDFIAERGGNPDKIRESQRRRHASVEVVDEIIAMFEEHRKGRFFIGVLGPSMLPSWHTSFYADQSCATSQLRRYPARN